MKKMTKQAKILLGVLLIAITVIVLFVVFSKPNKIKFNEEKVKIALDASFDPYASLDIKDDVKKDDIVIDSSAIDNKKIGTYTVIYTYDNYDYKLEVEVVDVVKPEFKIKDITVDATNKVDASQLVYDIVDQTETKATFDQEYSFDKEGEVKVKVNVTDACGNVTSKEATIKVLPKDTTEPTVEKFSDLTVSLDSKPNLKDGIKVKDNQDPNPTIEIDDSTLDLSKLGDYTITYTVSDRSGNKITFDRTIKVIEQVIIGRDQQSKEKIVYLTFDDGPSPNTEKILKILKKYNVKATFFVTGSNKAYRYLIKQAYADGHTIGLHAYAHNYAKIYKDEDAYFKDLEKIGDMVEDLIGVRSKYIRFPGGSNNQVSKNYNSGIMTRLTKEVIKRGYQYYDWNGDSTDASANLVSVNKLINAATSSRQNEIMMLSHDSQAKTTTPEALPSIIEYYQKKGYTFKAIDDESYTCHFKKLNN